MTAKPISDAFFAMAGAVAELDDHGEAIRKALRRSVSDQITFRNDVAHADWSLGWEVVDTGERVPDTAFKIKSVDGELKVVNLDMGTNTVIANINLLLELTESIRVFGRACRDIQCGRDQTLLQDLEVIASSSPGPARVRRIKSDGP